jgi:hypothetical protein
MTADPAATGERGAALAAAFQRAFDLRALLGAGRPAGCTPRPLLI